MHEAQASMDHVTKLSNLLRHTNYAGDLSILACTQAYIRDKTGKV